MVKTGKAPTFADTFGVVSMKEPFDRKRALYLQENLEDFIPDQTKRDDALVKLKRLLEKSQASHTMPGCLHLRACLRVCLRACVLATGCFFSGGSDSVESMPVIALTFYGKSEPVEPLRLSPVTLTRKAIRPPTGKVMLGCHIC
jgi:hypothetical protein